MMSSIKETLSNLVNGDEPLLNLRLVELSNLNPDELKFFEEPGLTLNRDGEGKSCIGWLS